MHSSQFMHQFTVDVNQTP